jgi:TPR repeat protein
MMAVEITKDPFKRLELSEKACRLEVGPGCTLAGIAYIEGTGARKDVQKARAFFEMACSSNEAHACLEMGYLVALQANTIEDYRQSMRHFGKACDLKEQTGCAEYARVEEFLEKRARARRSADEAARAESESQNRRITNCLAWNFAYPGRPCPFN